ncbi:MAG: glycosyltransferase [Actinomycetota bacterium]
MRILFVTDFYDPYTGGVEIHVKTVAEALAARGHEVGVATLPAGDHLPSRSDDGPVQVFPVEHTIARVGRGFAKVDRPWAPPMPDPVAMAGLRRVVRRFRPDVIHGHDWLARSVLPRVVSGSVPVVTTLHYYTRTCAKKTLWRDGRVCDGPSLPRCLHCAADHYGTARGAVVTVGLRVGAALEDRRSARHLSVSTATACGNGLGVDDNRSLVVPNPVTSAVLADEAGGGTATGTEATEGGDRTTDLGRDLVPEAVPSGPFVAFVGDLRPEKGIHVLLDAVGRLRRDHGCDVPLVLVGERTTDGLVQPSHTIELGPVDHEVVQAVWRRATVGVVPSLWPEPFGLVATEAMAAGCPLVASDIGGLADILGPDPDGTARGVLVAPGDAGSLAKALDELLGDPSRRRRLATAARASLDRYAIDAVVDTIEVAYRRAMGGVG